MKTISGTNASYKLQQIIQECVQKAQDNPFEQYIFICQNPQVIEQCFFQYTHYLVNIQVMSWNQYLQQLQMTYHLTHHHVLSQIEWVYHLRAILKNEAFHCFRSQNPYPFIEELIPLLKDYELYHIRYQHTSSLKLQDFMHMYRSLKKRLDPLTHLTFESLFTDVDFHEKDHLYIEADHLYSYQCQDIIQRLDRTCDITCLYTYHQDERLLNKVYEPFCQNALTIDEPTFLTEHLFLQTTQKQAVSHHYHYLAPTPLQEVQQVVYSIYQKIVDEKKRYQDFMIIYPQQNYRDALEETLNHLHMSHDLSQKSERLYEYSYQKILQVLSQLKATTFHDISEALMQEELDKDYLRYFQTTELFGEISPLEFIDFFKMTFPKQTQSTSACQDHIQVCCVEEAQMAKAKHLYILGMNETVFPYQIKDTALLLDEDIDLLKKEHSSTPLYTIERLGLHHNAILKALSQPYQSLTISCSTQTLSGEPLLPSSLYKQLCQMMTFVPMPSPVFLPLESYYLQGGLLEEKSQLNQNIKNYQECRNQPDALTFKSLQDLYSPYLSVSQIESYNQCPFAYFLQYGLHLSSQKENRLLPQELGSLIHYVLSITIDHPQDIPTLVQDYIHHDELLSDKINQSPLNQFFIQQLIDDLSITLKILKHYQQSGSFQIRDKEKKIQDQIREINFKGFVDRIDAYDSYISIIDYKSSSKNIDLNLAMQGFHIQMLLYLQMVTQLYEKIPGAVLYFNTKKRILSVQQPLGEPIEDHQFIKEYRYDGFVIDDGTHQSILGLDPTFDKRSDIIRVTYVKSRNSYKGQILSLSQYQKLMEKIEDHIQKLHQQIHDGMIAIAPKGSDQKTIHAQVNPCHFCPYHSICGFDVFYNDYQPVEFLSVSEILGGEDNAI